ncbi:hypothetical protein RB601_006201 [Gaeumannomyces tritici]
MTTPAADEPAAAAAAARPAFIPLEANPELMTDLVRKLGLSAALQCHDVFSIDEPEMLAFIPRPALALLLVFPVAAAYESHRLAEDSVLAEYSGSGDAEPVMWFRQTIRNACGMMAIVHAVSNGPARGFIAPGSTFDKLIKDATPLAPAERARLLETNADLAAQHKAAASRGDTEAPAASDDVDLHYVCFVKADDGTLWELDGRRKGPLARGTLADSEDVLSEKALLLGPRAFLERSGGDMRFSIVALAQSLD